MGPWRPRELVCASIAPPTENKGNGSEVYDPLRDGLVPTAVSSRTVQQRAHEPQPGLGHEVEVQAGRRCQSEVVRCSLPSLKCRTTSLPASPMVVAAAMSILVRSSAPMLARPLETGDPEREPDERS